MEFINSALFQVIGYLATATAVTGAVLNARRNRWGFVLWIIANSWFAFSNFLLAQYYATILWLTYTGISVCGFISWTKKEKV